MPVWPDRLIVTYLLTWASRPHLGLGLGRCCSPPNIDGRNLCLEYASDDSATAPRPERKIPRQSTLHGHLAGAQLKCPPYACLRMCRPAAALSNCRSTSTSAFWPCCRSAQHA
eukprot:359804-Chlamydomonas_euryale.AAC.10